MEIINLLVFRNKVNYTQGCVLFDCIATYSLFDRYVLDLLNLEKENIVDEVKIVWKIAYMKTLSLQKFAIEVVK